jgi:hypothetical protein
MDTRDQVSSMAASPVTPQPSEDRQAHYTGVVLIHGIGDIKRNTTLEEAVNTLAYWFNQKAGLALRREGDGRLWLTAQLTDDPNPDAPAARAAMNLVAPAMLATAPAGDAGLRLEFREVWWAESFGLPSVGATIKWAQVQLREQATHLLVPIGRRLGPAQTAARTPAREIPQALTYRPRAEGAGDSRAQTSNQEWTPDSTHITLMRAQRHLLTAVLGLYSLLQYVWKALQWLILTPLLFLLLLLLGPLRLLALIPPLRSTVVASITAVLDYIMLHWIAEAQVYALDYTRSAGIRERFEREVNAFLSDEQCDRIVVIAHSMGTVIAYEGLTSVLTSQEDRKPQKPTTFICLAQALRRVWLVAANDPHRLRGVLPDGVRWLHFWARYDPVAAGPLNARSLPQIDPWLDRVVPDPDEALRDRLERCENVDVVNTDSTFTDHTTYWQNLDQVVGPIAQELVAGHSRLAQIIAAHVATADDLLWRRWRVAWRAIVATAGGLAAGIGFFLWDWQVNFFSDPQADAHLVQHGLPSHPFGVGYALRTSIIPSLLRGLWESLIAGPIGQFIGSSTGAILQAFQKFSKFDVTHPAPPGATTYSSLPDMLYSAGAALALTAVLIVAVRSVVAIPSPLAFTRTISLASLQSARRIVVVATICLIFLAAASLAAASIFIPPSLAYGLHPSRYVPGFLQSREAVQWLLYLGWFTGLGAVVLTLVSAARNRQWGMYIPILALLAPLFAIGFQILPTHITIALTDTKLIPFYSRYGVTYLVYISGVLAAAGFVGCVLTLFSAARRRQWSLFITLLLVGFFLAAYLGPQTTIYDLFRSIPGVRDVAGTYKYFEDALVKVFGFWAAPAEAALIYAFWLYGKGSAKTAKGSRLTSGVLSLSTAAVLSLFVTVFLFSSHAADQIAIGGALSWSAAFVSTVTFGACLVDIIRRRRWRWLALMTALIAIALLYASAVFANGAHTDWRGVVLDTLLHFLLPAAITYGVWGDFDASLLK